MATNAQAQERKEEGYKLKGDEAIERSIARAIERTKLVINLQSLILNLNI